MPINAVLHVDSMVLSPWSDQTYTITERTHFDKPNRDLSIARWEPETHGIENDEG